jgi:cytochrome b subunit of formate dehydrogenase
MLREEIKSIKSGKKELRKFGVTVGAVLLLFAAFLFWKEKASFAYFAIVGGGLMVSGAIIPLVLKPVFIAWMSFAVVMGFVMTRVILTIIYFGLFTPIALVLRVLGKDLLEESWNKNASSYWVKREPQPYDRAAAERMF